MFHTSYIYARTASLQLKFIYKFVLTVTNNNQYPQWCNIILFQTKFKTET